METYKISIEVALLVFPFVAFLLTIPFLIHEYQKYGAIPLFKSIIFYSLILYLIAAYFMVILPLPSKAFVSKLPSIPLQFHPFNFINDIRLTSFKIKTLKDLLNFLNKPTVYTILFNFLLTMPFGFYLRYFFKKKWYQTIIYSFFLSLFFELTQLTGLYGYYPKAYRLFDVDDLIINTIGGLLGHIFSPLLMLFLPKREELEQKSYLKGQKVSLLRRTLALSIDILCVIFLDLVTRIILYNSIIENYSLLISSTVYFLILPLLTEGSTIGKKIVRIKISGITQKLTWYKLLLRNILLIYLVLFPFIWLNILERNFALQNNKFFLTLKVFIIIFQIINILYYLKSFFKKENIFLYEKLTNSKNISTIIVEKVKLETNNPQETVQKLKKTSSHKKKISSSVEKDLEKTSDSENKK